MTIRRSCVVARVLLLGVLALAGVGFTTQPTSALSLNPLDYYEYDYNIVFSNTEVEPEESFSITAGATVRCTKDLPIGVRNAAVSFSIVARHSSSGTELTLLDGYDFEVSDVPDWAGDEYSTTEAVDLVFPAGTAPGTYVIAARLENLSLDGWNVTSMVPSSSRTIGLGTIACIVPDEPPTPPPPPLPGTMTVSVLGHELRPTISSDGILTKGVDAILIEGLLSLQITNGTQCLDATGDPLEYVSATQALSPRAYEDGVVISAFNLFPNGARFSPALRLGIVYDPTELPPGCDEDDLVMGYYDSENEKWRALPSTVDKEQGIVSANASHFTTFGLLAPSATLGPARFTVRSLDVAPKEVPPFGRVTAAITIANTGDTQDQYPLLVTVNGKQEHAQDIELAPRQTKTVSFTIVRSEAGVYTVRVAEASGSFRVVAPEIPSASGDATSQEPAASPGGSDVQTSSDSQAAGGMHPVYVVLLALAGVAFLSLVILVLAGVL